MRKVIVKWFERNFSEPEAIFLVALFAVAIVAFAVMGNLLIPILASVIIAYMLTGFVRRLHSFGLPFLFSVLCVYCLFIGALLFLFVWLLPLLFQQAATLLGQTPQILNRGQNLLLSLQASHPNVVSATQLHSFLASFSGYFTRIGRAILSFSVASIGNIIAFVVYFILVPLLIFFFLKDREQIVSWLLQFLPPKRPSLSKIWQEVDAKIGDYIRGKIIEILLVSAVSMVTFFLIGLHFAILLGALVGLSVVIPYVGAILVTVPVIVVALVEWGWCGHFAYLAIAYTVIIALDANVLVPLLFSETMQLHAVVIVLAVLVFGKLWGFWGVFFAIPLATLANALLKGWPKRS